MRKLSRTKKKMKELHQPSGEVNKNKLVSNTANTRSIPGEWAKTGK